MLSLHSSTSKSYRQTIAINYIIFKATSFKIQVWPGKMDQSNIPLNEPALSIKYHQGLLFDIDINLSMWCYEVLHHLPWHSSDH